MRLGALATALILLAPLAGAVESHGAFHLQSPLSLPPGAVVRAQGPVLFWPDVSASTELSFHAERVVVEHYKYNRIAGTNARTENVSTTSFATDAGVTLTDAAGGYLGVYAGEDRVDASIRPATSFALLTKEPQRIGNADASNAPSDAGTTHFWQDVRTPFLLCQCRGAVEFSGDLAIKVMGPTIQVASREGTQTYRTGSVEGSSPLAHDTTSWLILTLRNATGRVASPSSFVLGVAEVEAAVDGLLTFRATEGELVAGGERLAPSRQVAQLMGRFDLTASAMRATDGGGVATQLTLQGDLESTNLAGARVPVRDPGSGWPWILLLAAVATAAGGAVGVRALARRRGATRLSLEECVDLAAMAADEGRFGDALDWNRRAQRLAPRRGALKADEGWYLSRLGDVDGALAAYAAAAARSDDGQADYLAAVLLLDVGHPPEQAEARLVRALERTPSLALEVEDEPAFDALRDRPAVRRAVEEALGKVE